MRSIRGNRIGMIFQEPMTSLNPVFTVGDQIVEAVMLHRGATYAEARDRAISCSSRRSRVSAFFALMTQNDTTRR